MAELPVFVVNDDADDHLLIEEIWKELRLKNPLKIFTNGDELINELKFKNTLPFIIISDVNLYKMDGFTLRQKLLDDDVMNSKSIPFIFWSAQATKEQTQKAYDLSVHGFFVKEPEFEEMKDTFKRIIQYWFKSKSPEKL